MTAAILALASAAAGQFCPTPAPAFSFAPTHSFAPTYSVAAPAYVAASSFVVAPAVKEVQFVAVEPSYSVALAGDYIRRERAEAEFAALVDEVRRLRSSFESAAAPQQAALTPTAAPAPPPPPQADGGFAALSRACARCHTVPAAAGAGFSMFDASGALAPLSASDRMRALRAAASGSMPPDGTPVGDAELRALATWVGQ